jgi:hypothetical protein
LNDDETERVRQLPRTHATDSNVSPENSAKRSTVRRVASVLFAEELEPHERPKIQACHAGYDRHSSEGDNHEQAHSFAALCAAATWAPDMANSAVDGRL